MALTEEQRKVRNVNKGNNLIGQADHAGASSNINSIEGMKRYEKAEHRFCKWLGENTELKNLKNVSAKYIYNYVASLFDRECKTSYIRTEMSAISPNKIAETFNDEHIPIPSDYKEQKFGIPNTRRSHHLWSCSTVKQIITNPIYLGHLVQMRTTTVSYKNKKTVKRDPEDMVTVYNTHEAIVTQELWDKCREMEASVSQGKKTKRGTTLPLSGLVFCCDCGSKMHAGWNNTRHSRKGPRIHYRENFKCGSYAKFGDRACSSHYIKMDTLNKIVLEDIRSKMTLVQTDEQKARAEFLKHCEQITATETAQDRKRANQINRRLGELEKLITAAYEDKVAGKIPEDICVNLLNRYVEEKNKLKVELSEIEKRQAEANKDKADVDEFIRRLKAYRKVPELTREMCMELIEFVTVDKCPGKYSKAPREIHIYYKLIDKQPIPEKKYVNNSTCEDC